MGRAVLKALKESTLLTFFEICKEWGLKKDVHWKYNSVDGVIRFSNGSEVFLKDLALYPSDPEFDSLGSTEYTGSFIDEGAQVSDKARNIVKSRLRYKLEEFNIIPKQLIASNPSKNFLYYDFYKPWKAGTLPEHMAFVRSLVTDNPYISPHYIENLKKLDKVSKERLLYGNFEYDDDPSRLMEYDAILDIFTNSRGEGKERYLTGDIARFGRDSTVLIVWEGFHILFVFIIPKSGLDVVKKKIDELAEKYQIRRSRIVVDEDVLGGGIVDFMPGVKGFVNNAKQRIQNITFVVACCQANVYRKPITT